MNGELCDNQTYLAASVYDANGYAPPVQQMTFDSMGRAILH